VRCDLHIWSAVSKREGVPGPCESQHQHGSVSLFLSRFLQFPGQFVAAARICNRTATDESHSLDIHYATLETCSAATDTVVVIDVWRSFTTAACAFAAGAHDIVPVGSVKEALALRGRFPGALLMGMGVSLVGPPAEGFDFGNSPMVLMGSDLCDRRVIQCTPNGTQGIVRSEKAESLLTSSFVCAGATVRYIKQQSPAAVTFVRTGPEGEDQACGEYMAALLRDETPHAAAVLSGIRKAGLQRMRALIAKGLMTEAQGVRLKADLDCCLSLDWFDFAMLVQRQDGLLVMKAVF
jgi:2-phosphosulfolactate phosphatase